MSVQQSVGWNEWVTAAIRAELRAHEKAIINAAVQWVDEYVGARVKALEVEIGQLRADQTIERAHKVIDLPNWRKRA
jgi:hypothetical protein